MDEFSSSMTTGERGKNWEKRNRRYKDDKEDKPTVKVGGREIREEKERSKRFTVERRHVRGPGEEMIR